MVGKLARQFVTAVKRGVARVPPKTLREPAGHSVSRAVRNWGDPPR